MLLYGDRYHIYSECHRYYRQDYKHMPWLSALRIRSVQNLPTLQTAEKYGLTGNPDMNCESEQYITAYTLIVRYNRAYFVNRRQDPYI